MSQKPLELILARNLLTSLSTPAFLVDESGALVFYNEAAGTLLGISFEEQGRLPAEEWRHAVRPLRRATATRSPTTSCRSPRLCAGAAPATPTFTVRSAKGETLRDRVTALPIVAEGGQEGAMIFFWPGRTTHRAPSGAIRWGRREVMVRTK